jgi:hypothetical protein
VLVAALIVAMKQGMDHVEFQAVIRALNERLILDRPFDPAAIPTGWRANHVKVAVAAPQTWEETRDFLE